MQYSLNKVHLQMTAAEFIDIISRLPGCAGQAADAVSAYTHVKMEDAPKLLKIPNRNVQTFGFVYHDTNGQNHGPVRKTQSFLFGEICTVILWQDSYGKCRYNFKIATESECPDCWIKSRKHQIAKINVE